MGEESGTRAMRGELQSVSYAPYFFEDWLDSQTADISHHQPIEAGLRRSWHPEDCLAVKIMYGYTGLLSQPMVPR